MPPPDAASWFSERRDGLRLSVKVTPRAARDGEREANAETIRLLARHLDVAPRDLSVVRGASGRRKVLHLRASAAALSARLQATA